MLGSARRKSKAEAFFIAWSRFASSSTQPVASPSGRWESSFIATNCFLKAGGTMKEPR